MKGPKPREGRVTGGDKLLGRNFCRELQQPICEPISPLALLQPGGKQGRNDRIKAARARKFLLLFSHYGLSPDKENDWPTLAFAMALDLVPGFAVVEALPRRAGRPHGSTPNDNFSLANDIEELALCQSITQSRACTLLVKRRSSDWKGQSHRTLYSRYLRLLQSFGTTPQEQMTYLRSRLEQAKVKLKANDLMGAVMFEEPIFRILFRPDSTKMP